MLPDQEFTPEDKLDLLQHYVYGKKILVNGDTNVDLLLRKARRFLQNNFKTAEEKKSLIDKIDRKFKRIVNELQTGVSEVFFDGPTDENFNFDEENVDFVDFASLQTALTSTIGGSKSLPLTDEEFARILQEEEYHKPSVARNLFGAPSNKNNSINITEIFNDQDKIKSAKANINILRDLIATGQIIDEQNAGLAWLKEAEESINDPKGNEKASWIESLEYKLQRINGDLERGVEKVYFDIEDEESSEEGEEPGDEAYDKFFKMAVDAGILQNQIDRGGLFPEQEEAINNRIKYGDAKTKEKLKKFLKLAEVYKSCCKEQNFFVFLTATDAQEIEQQIPSFGPPTMSLMLSDPDALLAYQLDQAMNGGRPSMLSMTTQPFKLSSLEDDPKEAHRKRIGALNINDKIITEAATVEHDQPNQDINNNNNNNNNNTTTHSTVVALPQQQVVDVGMLGIEKKEAVEKIIHNWMEILKILSKHSSKQHAGFQELASIAMKFLGKTENNNEYNLELVFNKLIQEGLHSEQEKIVKDIQEKIETLDFQEPAKKSSLQGINQSSTEDARDKILIKQICEMILAWDKEWKKRFVTTTTASAGSAAPGAKSKSWLTRVSSYKTLPKPASSITINDPIKRKQEAAPRSNHYSLFQDDGATKFTETPDDHKTKRSKENSDGDAADNQSGFDFSGSSFGN